LQYNRRGVWLLLIESREIMVLTRQMKTVRSISMVRGAGAGRWAGLLAVLLLGLLASPAQALLVTINLGWGYNQNEEGNSLDPYHLKVGSIIQVVMFDQSTATPPGPDANDNFDLMGNYPSNPDGLDDTTVYDPLSAPEGHVIVYSTSVQEAEYLDGNGNVWWNVYVEFTIVGPYDALYLRVFETTQFSDGIPDASYWGLSDVVYGTNLIGTWPVGIVDNVAATNQNYFEVIPEPGVMALMALGGIGLLAGARRRRNRLKKGGGADRL
jgi:hypothetical protein